MSLLHKHGAIASAVRRNDPSFANVAIQQYFPQYLKDKSALSQNLLPMGMVNRRNDISKFGGGSMQWDRNGVNGSGYSLETNTYMDLSNSDFTLECWVYADHIPAAVTYLFGRYYDSSTFRGWKFGYDKTNKRMTFTFVTDGTTNQVAYFRMGTTNDGVTEAGFFNSAWHHVAVTRVSGVIYVHVDGLQGNTTVAISTTAITAASCYTVIGSVANSATLRRVLSSPWEGCIDELRFTIGFARYAAGTFTVPSTRFGRSAATDANFSYVKLLLSFEARFTFSWEGNYPQSIIYNGGTVIDQPISDADGLTKFSGQVNQYFPYDSSYNLTTGDFTIELFGVKFTYGNASFQIFGCWDTASPAKCWRIAVGGALIRFEWTTDGTTVQTASFGVATLVNATAYGPLGLAVVRSGSNLYLYVNGVRNTATSISGSIFTQATNSVRLSYMNNANNAEGGPLTLRIKSMRLTKSARYTGASYTVPKLPLPIS